jgi:hypothetical protein
MMMDETTELADRLQAKQRRGEAWDLEFKIEFGALTDEERDAFLALMNERAAHGKEKLEAIEAQYRALKALLRLLLSSDAPPGTTLWEAGHAEYIGVMEVVEAVRAVPDLLAAKADENRPR